MGFLIHMLQICVLILTLPIHLLWLFGLWDPLAKKLLPRILVRCTGYYNNKMYTYKKALFSTMTDFSDPSGKLRVLEIGCGTGANFQFFPPGCQVTCVDPNPGFKKFLCESFGKNDHIQFDCFLEASGENMSAVASGSVDVLVSTLVLCSVNNVEAILKEVVRVLRPGGVFYFLEHVAADTSTWSYFFQQVYQPSWKRAFWGCHLTRKSWKDIERAPFSEQKIQHIWAPFSWNPSRAHIIGYAIK